MKITKYCNRLNRLMLFILLMVMPNLAAADGCNPVDEDDKPNHQWRDGALSQGRKISLSGMPMPDVAQHQEGESDYQPEDTYIDALSLDIQHNVTDIFVPVGSDHFSLEVRRNLGQEVWNVNSVYFENRPDLPFGPCWSSAICASLQVSTTDGSSYKTYAAQDHNGQTYSMKGIKWNDMTNDVDMLWVEPKSTQSALSMNGVDLSVGSLIGTNTNTTATAVILSLPNGTKCYYSVEPTITVTNSYVEGDGTSYQTYYRMESVVDRAGNSLTYNYSTNNSLIPTNIVASTGQEIQIHTIDNNGRQIDWIRDPEGNCINYSYTDYAFAYTNYSPYINSNYTCRMLHTVTREDGGVTTYTYQHNREMDTRAGSTPVKYRIHYDHLTISNIVDAAGNTNTFLYSKPDRFDYAFGDDPYFGASHEKPQIGNNRILSSLTRPDGSEVFLSEGTNGLGTVMINRIYYLNADRTTTVTDVNSNEWSYVFSEPHATDPLELGSGVSSELRLFEYKKMEIFGPCGAVESYHYDVLGITLPTLVEPLAISAQTNFSGQGTMFAYNGVDDGFNKPTTTYDALGHATHTTYTTNFGNQVESSTDALGRYTLYKFDNIGNRTNVTTYASSSMEVKLSESWMMYGDTNFPNFMTKKVVKRFDASEPDWVVDMVTEYTPHQYGKKGTSTVVLNATNRVETIYDYDRNNNLVSTIDPRGNEIVNTYDELNRLTTISFYDGCQTNGTLKCTKQFWYDQRSNKRWEKDEEDHYTYFEYNEFNSEIKKIVVMRDNGTGQGEFDPAIIATMTTNNYAGGYAGVPSVDIVSLSEYNVDGTVHAVVDPRGMRTEYQYDDLRRLTNSIVDADYAGHTGLKRETACIYGNNCGGITLPPYKFTPTTVTDPRGYETETVYDALNRKIETWAEIVEGEPLVKLTAMDYDAVGNSTNSVVYTTASGEYQKTRTRYDDLNRPTMVINPDNTTNRTVYTSTGLQWKSIDEMGRESETEYDAAGRAVKTLAPILDGSRAVTETGYDANGNVEWEKDANFNVTSKTYDYRNRLLQTISPSVRDWSAGGAYDQPITSKTYDHVGNETSSTDALGNTTTNIYDAANRLVVTLSPEVLVYGKGLMCPGTTNEYNKSGDIVCSYDSNGNTTQMQYDSIGQLTNTIDGIGNTISQQYDASGNQTVLLDGAGNRTEFQYDGLGRKTSTLYIGDGSGTTHEDSEYDLVGNRVKRIDCNGEETEYEYDKCNRLEYITYPADSIGWIRRRTYSYDDVGNLESVTENNGYEYHGWNAYSNIAHAAVSYAYDALNRVTNETSSGVTHTYRYDLNGNRTSATYGVTGRQVEWTYDALNRISRIKDLTTIYADTYTANSSSNLQSVIDDAVAGSLILVDDGTYGSIVVTNSITIKSLNGPGSAFINAGNSGRAASLSGGCKLVGFTLTDGLLGGMDCGAGAFVDEGCVISDCIISNNETTVCEEAVIPGGKGGGLYLKGTALRCTITDNTAWNGAGAYLEDGASMSDCTISYNNAIGVNSYGGGLYLRDGATAVNCMVEGNQATDGGGLFFEQGGYAQSISSIYNEVDSIGGAGAFLWAGGTLCDGYIMGNVATNTYARGGAGIMFYDEGGLVENSTISGNTSIANSGVDYGYSGDTDPVTLGTLNDSILWDNGSQSISWSGTGNQFVDPSTTAGASTGADIATYTYEDANTKSTYYHYDLNDNIVERIYPNRVVETRSFDALGHLVSMKTASPGREWFKIEYSYDAAGNMLQQEHTRSDSLAGKAPVAVHSWEYDDRYRLREETIAIDGGTTYETSYTWDDADNRLSKTAYSNSVCTASIMYANNAYNQIESWYDSVAKKAVTYAYDANGSRTNRTALTSDSTNVTTYVYDDDNRLLQASVGSIVNTFKYDYRSRRVYRATSTETNICVFDGGLSVQEYDASSNSEPQVSTLKTEYIRGPDLGGGVGGMVYSIRRDSNGLDRISCSHSNHRGDVIARSDASGYLAWFALYEAYGSRPYEWGTNLDRQKANTKDEEAELGLINEGMRYRDIETGTFLTRDPIGYEDGPNVYCYVHCNPITGFDPYGLWNWKTFGKALAKSVVVAAATIVVVAAVVAVAPIAAAAVGISASACAVVSATATVAGTAMAAYGTVKTGESIYAVATGKEAWTGRELEEGERETIAGNLAGDAIMAVAGGALARSAGKGISKVMNYKCFVAGTLVWTATAGAVPIEDIKVGDAVLSYDFESGKQVYSEVVRPMERSYSGEIAYVQVGDEEIASTANHPFWVVDGEDLEERAVPEDSGLDEGGAGPSRWVCAGDLRVGDTVQLGDGSTQAVSNIRIEPQNTTVYNMEVAGTHNYYVSDLRVLVHNKCGQPQKTSGIYEFKDHQTGQTYVGQSKNIERRLTQHQKTGKLDPDVDISTVKKTELKGSTKAQREVAEQTRINELTGGEGAKSDLVSNKVNPIGPKRQHLMDEQ